MTDLFATFAPTYADLIQCVERELAMRRRVYPRLVARGKMKAAAAERETALMEAIVIELKRLNKTRARF